MPSTFKNVMDESAGKIVPFRGLTASSSSCLVSPAVQLHARTDSFPARHGTSDLVTASQLGLDDTSTRQVVG